MSLILDYLKLHDEYLAQYGSKTVVLMQLGSFYEMYSLRSSEGYSLGSSKGCSLCSPIERGPDLFSISSLLNLIVVTKNEKINGQDILMAGFPCISSQKFIAKLSQYDWNVVVIERINNPYTGDKIHFINKV